VRRLLLVLMAVAGCAAAPARAPESHKLRVLVVTGGHGFKAQPFFRMFDEDPDITYVAAKQ